MANQANGYGYSAQFDRALVLASIVHYPEPRKGTQVPYIIHPVHVAAILQRHGFDEAVQIAGLLHDVLEDADSRDREMRKRLADTFSALSAEVTEEGTFQVMLADFIGEQFGARVRALVEAMTQQKRRANGDKIPRAERHQTVLGRLERADDLEFIALKASDSLHNAQSIATDLHAKGLQMMARFNGPPDETVAYYRDVGRIVSRKLGSHALAAELTAALDTLVTTLDQALKGELDKLKSIAQKVATL